MLYILIFVYIIREFNISIFQFPATRLLGGWVLPLPKIVGGTYSLSRHLSVEFQDPISALRKKNMEFAGIFTF